MIEGTRSPVPKGAGLLLLYLPTGSHSWLVDRAILKRRGKVQCLAYVAHEFPWRLPHELTFSAIPNGALLPLGVGSLHRRLEVKLQTTEQKLSNVLLFTIDVRLVSGRKRVRPEDIEDAKGVKMDADAVMTLGSKKVFEPEKLNTFDRLKDSMHRECLKVGTQFLSGYAVPEAKADALAIALDAIAKKGEQERDNLLANYANDLDEFCKAHPEWESSIRNHAYSEAYIRDRIRFGFNAIKVLAGRDNGVIADSLKNQVGGLLGSLLGDIADEAEELQAKSLKGKDKKNRKVLRPLMAARDKLIGFTFLDPRLQSVADLIKMVEDKMPESGAIEGANLALLWSITSVLCDPRKTLEMADVFAADASSALAMLSPSHTAPAMSKAIAEDGQGIGFAELMTLGSPAAEAPNVGLEPKPAHESIASAVSIEDVKPSDGTSFFSLFENTMQVETSKPTPAHHASAHSVVPTGFDALSLA